MPGPQPRDPLLRFNEKWREEDRGYVTPCHIWTSAKNNAGRGMFRISQPRRNVLAHRWIFAQYVEIPDDVHVCHHCDQGDCVRFDHLFAGTQQDNLQDMVAKGRHHNQVKTACGVCGGSYVLLKNGKRRCPACFRRQNREAVRRSRARRRAA